jgi:hypothetical protein
MKKIFFVTILLASFICCNMSDIKNHIDKYEINIDTLKTLPNNFYAYRRGSIFIEDTEYKNYRLWFRLDELGNIKNVFRVDDLKNYKENPNSVLKKYNIDTLQFKKNAQKFIELSRKFKFGHINIDKENKIYFSNRDGLSEQYVKVFTDSLKIKYSNDKQFKLLKNGWFENIEN